MIRQTLAAVLAAAAIGAGCSFTPVYSGGSPINAMSLAFNFAKPSSRLEQIAYQELALRFAMSSAPNTPELRVSVAAAHRDKTMSRNSAVVINGATVGTRDEAQVEVTVTAVATLDGEEIFRAVRRATAPYASSLGDQVLMNTSIRQAAEETATKAATESLRLAILAKFPDSGSYL